MFTAVIPYNPNDPSSETPAIQNEVAIQIAAGAQYCMNTISWCKFGEWLGSRTANGLEKGIVSAYYLGDVNQFERIMTRAEYYSYVPFNEQNMLVDTSSFPATNAVPPPGKTSSLMHNLFSEAPLLPFNQVQQESTTFVKRLLDETEEYIPAAVGTSAYGFLEDELLGACEIIPNSTGENLDVFFARSDLWKKAVAADAVVTLKFEITVAAACTAEFWIGEAKGTEQVSEFSLEYLLPNDSVVGGGTAPTSRIDLTPSQTDYTVTLTNNTVTNQPESPVEFILNTLLVRLVNTTTDPIGFKTTSCQILPAV